MICDYIQAHLIMSENESRSGVTLMYVLVLVFMTAVKMEVKEYDHSVGKR